MELLKHTLNSIEPVNEEVKEKVKLKWDSLVKPLGSLGVLEELSIKISGMTGQAVNRINKRAVVVMSADNGILDEGVSSSPKMFTRLLTESMAQGITGVATLAKFANTDIITVDIGIDADIEDGNIINRKIAYGTKNFSKGPAMTYEEAVKSIEIGIEIGDSLFKEGYDILGTGELGMGNTTTSAAVLSVFTDEEAEKTCGVGAGTTEEQMKNKINSIKKGIEVNNPDKDDPIDVISKVGGFDIGGMCGLFLSAAKNKKPIVIDGFISSAAALCAIKLNPRVRDYTLTSHLSDEPGSKLMFKELGLEPMLNLKMRLGEGSGCPLAFQIIDSALYTLDNMGTFKEASVDSSILLDMREK